MQSWNLALRFVLELTALAGIGLGSWALTDGWLLWITAVLAPLLAATVWGVFNVPDDPSRSGKAPIIVPGRVRFTIEIVVFGAGFAGFLIADLRTLAWTYLVAVVVHHAASVPRLRWLLT